MAREYKIITEDAAPKADLEARLESTINNLSADDWKVKSIFQGITGMIIVLMERELAQAAPRK
jgi:hypothetical protein